MKTLVNHYTFDKVTRRITFSNLTSIQIEQILLITNLNTNTIIYNFADPNLGGTTINNELVLNFNTNIPSMNNTDRLQIFIDIPNSTDLETLAQVMLDGFASVVTQLQSMKKAQGLPDSGGRLRVNVETGWLGTVSNVGSIGGWNAAPLVMAQSNVGWARLRDKISLS